MSGAVTAAAVAPGIEPETTPILEVRRLSSGYGDLQVLRGVSLSIAPGTVEVVLGRNGVGKTTLLSTICGLVPTWDGEILLAGEDVARAPAHRRARAGIALVQEGKRVFRSQSVLQNVVIGTFVERMRRTARMERAEEALSYFPILEEMRDRRAADLSGGQQQMLAIAQALAGRPDILLLDEPSAGLAPVITAEVFRQVRQLRDRGITVLLVEQLADLALDIADHVTVIDRGEVAESGPPQRFHDRDELHEAYFGSSAER